MKKLLSFLLITGSLSVGAQSVGITQGQYDALKANGQLVPGVQYTVTDAGGFTPQPYTGAAYQTRSACNCLLPLDTTFMIAMAPNDDFYTDTITLPFTFNFYGNPYNSLFINNNGNISFWGPYSTFTANPFPDSTYNMIAPFWADVDTRDSLGGVVYYKITPTSMIVKWENVGYYAFHSDLLNTFQLIITDGTDPILPAGNNVSFCYGDMQWTTGDASGGMGGFGGVPATVGVNMGNGTNYFQVGRFDQAGNAFDGPYGLSDGVDFLDNQEIYFDVSTPINIPPVIMNSILCDTIDVFTGDTLRAGDAFEFDISVSTPEIDQIVTATITCTAPGALTTTMVANGDVFKKYTCSFDAAGLPDGLYYVNISASDNGVPVRTSTSTVVIKVSGATGVNDLQKTNEVFNLYPNPANQYITVKGGQMQRVAVVDVLGHVVMQENVNATQHSLSLSALGNGVYFIKITGENGAEQSLKFLKK